MIHHRLRSDTARRRLRWWILASGLVLFLGLTYLAESEPRPKLEPSAGADALAEAMIAAVHGQAWQETGAVRWTFRGSRQHLWDRKRQLERARWDDVEVLIDLATRQGRAWKQGEEVAGPERDKLVEKAWEAWVNDSFWLNPVVKAFDEGTRRGLVQLDGNDRGLLVEYSSGGVTPGDAYLWILGPDDRPVRWKMWVSIIPVGGVEASWEGWTELETGALVATRHKLALGKVDLTDVAGAANLTDLEPGPDPFAPLLAAGSEAAGAAPAAGSGP
ncbi:MAG: hypothetical protein KDD11_19055 [Acidobacteria bacterium]|nr:hypothetical protein [Acidobacteriota bacterium]